MSEAIKKLSIWNFWAWISWVELLDIAEGPVLLLQPCAGSSQFVTHACGVGVGVGVGTQRGPPWLRGHSLHTWPASFTALTFLDKSKEVLFLFYAVSFCYSSVRKHGLENPEIPSEGGCSKLCLELGAGLGSAQHHGPAVFSKGSEPLVLMTDSRSSDQQCEHTCAYSFILTKISTSTRHSPLHWD